MKKIFMIFIICTLLSFMLAESAISSEDYYVRIGKLACVPNPCRSETTTTCFPGVVWAIKNDNYPSGYILYFNGSWSWCDTELHWNGHTFKVRDLVIVIIKNGIVEDIMPICLSLKIYGEYSEEVELLRYIRDNILNKTPEGRELIKLYYQWSPLIVKAMEEDEEFKEDVKEVIDEVLGLVGGDIE